MKNINIEELKNKIKAKTGITIVFGALLLTLMGCGKTNQDTQVTTGPDTTVETTVDDPVVDVPVVEPTTDVSGNEVEPVEEHDFSDATFVQTGDNSYTIYVDCQDNSNAPELGIIPSLDLHGTVHGTSTMCGVSENLILAVMTYGTQVSPNNISPIDMEKYGDQIINVNLLAGDRLLVLTDNPSLYGDDVFCITMNDVIVDSTKALDNDIPFTRNVMYLKSAMQETNGNIELGLLLYDMGPAAFEQMMQECEKGANLTRDEIYAHYGAEFVSQFDTLGLADPAYPANVLQYVDGDIVITQYGEMGAVISTTTCTVEKEKTLTLN